MKRTPRLTEADVTPESIFNMKRRQVLKTLGLSAAAMGMPGVAQADILSWFKGNDRPPAPAGRPLDFTKPAQYQADLTLTPADKVSGYNNFYEFGLDKADPAANAGTLKTEPWKLTIDGEVAKPVTLDMDDIFKRFAMEQRIYRMRCVEAWSMVIPWIGFPISALLKQVEPTSKARFIRFETLQDPKTMPGQRSGFALIDWPYVEGLRLDEAMNPLAILAVGMYGRELPNQNGAPLRLVVPWKYGFKSVKSIVRISLVSEQPKTTWQSIASDEYGFYANVNPTVDHPRWTQAHERRLPSGLFSPNVRDTLMFNGYQEEVASLYAGMDLRKDY